MRIIYLGLLSLLIFTINFQKLNSNIAEIDIVDAEKIYENSLYITDDNEDF